MAISMSALSGGTGGSNTDATSYATGSVTLTANRLYLISVSNRKTGSSPDTPTITGWTQVATQLNVAPNERCTVLRQLPGSDSTGTHTIDFGGATQLNCQWAIIEITGHDTSGTNGSGAIVQSKSGQADVTSSFSLTFDAAFGDSTNNATFGAIACNAVSADTFITPDVNMTELTEISATGLEPGHQETQWKLGEEATVNWTTSSNVDSAYIIVEIKAAVAATAVKDLIGVGFIPFAR